MKRAYVLALILLSCSLIGCTLVDRIVPAAPRPIPLRALPHSITPQAPPVFLAAALNDAGGRACFAACADVTAQCAGEAVNVHAGELHEVAVRYVTEQAPPATRAWAGTIHEWEREQLGGLLYRNAQSGAMLQRRSPGTRGPAHSAGAGRQDMGRRDVRKRLCSPPSSSAWKRPTSATYGGAPSRCAAGNLSTRTECAEGRARWSSTRTSTVEEGG